MGFAYVVCIHDCLLNYTAHLFQVQSRSNHNNNRWFWLHYVRFSEICCCCFFFNEILAVLWCHIGINVKLFKK